MSEKTRIILLNETTNLEDKFAVVDFQDADELQKVNLGNIFNATINEAKSGDANLAEAIGLTAVDEGYGLEAIADSNRLKALNFEQYGYEVTIRNALRLLDKSNGVVVKATSPVDYDLDLRDCDICLIESHENQILSVTIPETDKKIVLINISGVEVEYEYLGVNFFIEPNQSYTLNIANGLIYFDSSVNSSGIKWNNGILQVRPKEGVNSTSEERGGVRFQNNEIRDFDIENDLFEVDVLGLNLTTGNTGKAIFSGSKSYNDIKLNLSDEAQNFSITSQNLKFCVYLIEVGSVLKLRMENRRGVQVKVMYKIKSTTIN
jgi:hypothetical protein